MTQIIRHINAFVEGYSTHLEIEELTPPKLTDKSEETKAGGLIAGYDVSFGFEKLEAGLKLNSQQKEVMKHVGLRAGVHKRFTFRGHAVSEIDGSNEDHVIVIEGRLQSDPGNWAAQAIAKPDYKIGSILFYKHMVAGTVMHHIDLKNMIGIVNGEDQYSTARSALGF